MSAFLSAPRILFEEQNAADVRCFLRGNKSVELSMGSKKRTRKTLDAKKARKAERSYKGTTDCFNLNLSIAQPSNQGE